jgi:hypothetical protein
MALGGPEDLAVVVVGAGKGRAMAVLAVLGVVAALAASRQVGQRRSGQRGEMAGLGVVAGVPGSTEPGGLVEERLVLVVGVGLGWEGLFS